MTEPTIETIRAPGHEFRDEIIVFLREQIALCENPMSPKVHALNQKIVEVVKLEAATMTYRVIVPIGHPFLETLKIKNQ